MDINSSEDNFIFNKTLEQNNSFLKKINPKFKEAGKYIIARYDWKNSPLDFPEDYKNLEKIIEFTKIYIERREEFLNMMGVYLG